MERLRRRADFLAAARGTKWVAPGFILQARRRGEGEAAPRIGFTASRKVGNAVRRNRARRRLKEIARLALAPSARAGLDYVLIARHATVTVPFASLLDDIPRALGAVHKRLGEDPAGSTSGTEAAISQAS
jgi:ribonuclease P protein component